MKKVLPVILIVIFLIIPLAMWYFGAEKEWVAITVAWLVGLAAILETQIRRIFFPPILGVKRIEEVPTTTNIGLPQKWYNLVITNSGFESAKNVMVKIRDNEKRGWVNLKRPFGNERTQPIILANLSAREEEAFNIGYLEGNSFYIAVDIFPNNQRFNLPFNENQVYFLEIVADNTNPYSFKMEIKNKGNAFDISCIKLL